MKQNPPETAPRDGTLIIGRFLDSNLRPVAWDGHEQWINAALSRFSSRFTVARDSGFPVRALGMPKRREIHRSMSCVTTSVKGRCASGSRRKVYMRTVFHLALSVLDATASR